MRRRRLLTILVVAALLLPGTAIVVRPRAQAASQPPVAEVVSVTAEGQPANADALAPSVSGDGGQVAFVTSATNLVDVPGQGAGVPQVIVHEPATGRNRLASVAADGRAGDAGGTYRPGSGNPYLSADGRYVAFDSKSANLAAGDTNRGIDVFVKDMQSDGGAVRVSVTSAGTQTERLTDSEATGISADGRQVAFTSDSRNLDGAQQRYRKLFVHDRQTGTTARASFPGMAVSPWPTISADGRFAVWGNRGRPGGFGRPCPGGTWYDHGLFMRDLGTGEVTTIASQPTTCTTSYALYAYPSVSADGRLVAYVYNDGAAPPDQASQIHLYDRERGTSSLVSADASGAPSNQGSTFPRLSGDGRSMAFLSASTNLLSDQVTSTSVLRREVATGELSAVRLNLAATPGWSWLSNYSTEGRRIAYVDLDQATSSLQVHLADHGPEGAVTPLR
jgi:Tol biopolymer transport system component